VECVDFAGNRNKWFRKVRVVFEKLNHSRLSKTDCCVDIVIYKFLFTICLKSRVFTIASMFFTFRSSTESERMRAHPQTAAAGCVE